MLLAEIEQLKSVLKSSHFSLKMLEGNDIRTKFYTGLPSWSVFLYVFMLVPLELNSRGNALRINFFLTLAKLWLNLLFKDIAHKFGISLAQPVVLF